MSEAAIFSYYIPWRSRSLHGGAHRGLQTGLGMEFRATVPLIDYPDARRIDLRESLRNPAEQLQVRTFNQKTPTPVYAACDLSGSMRFGNKLARTADIAASIAASAHDIGDRFGLAGFDDGLPDEWQLLPGAPLQEAMDRIRQLHSHGPGNTGAAGMQLLAETLGSQRTLVFLVSDFHLPLAQLEAALNTLVRHQVVPLVLWDEAEYRRLPRFGIGAIVDPENGARRTMLFRDTLRARFEAVFACRRAQLEALFLRYDMPPLFIEGVFDPAALTEYFQQFSAP
jgi:uncharacterized protein (DUF58 family)